MVRGPITTAAIIIIGNIDHSKTKISILKKLENKHIHYRENDYFAISMPSPSSRQLLYGVYGETYQLE